ncbi:MAG: NUDIX domain-containing protein [Hyphomicrobiaceae bacterium]|nr:NUDIX domain-containing protein [Hyphomicrobiaceae bacterium]
MPKRSAGILLYRMKDGAPEVLLVHPGGPYWARKDEGSWSIPKGELGEGEEPLAAARREFEEETGFRPAGEAVPLGSFRQPGGKVVLAWAVAGDLDPDGITSGTFTIEWPPRSGRMREFPEVDRAGWFRPAQAMRKILCGQAPALEALWQRLRSGATPGRGAR